MHLQNVPMKPALFNLAQAAKMAGISEALLILWIKTERFLPSIEETAPFTKEFLGWNRFLYDNDDIKHLRQKAETIAKVKRKHRKGDKWTAKQLAAAWGLTITTIGKIFKDEPGTVKVRTTRSGTRPLPTLLIPEAVADRVERRMWESSSLAGYSL